MAHTYTNTPVLSKVKIGDQVYFLKDAELRSVVDTLEATVAALDPSSGGNTFGSAAFEDVAQSISENGTGLTTSAQVYDFVTDTIGDLSGGLKYKSGTRAQQVDPEAGDIVVEGSKEYLYTGSNWIELGDESLWVPSSRTIAGLDLTSDITVAALQEALEMGTLASKNYVRSSVDDYVTGINNINFTPNGSVSLTKDNNGFEITGSNTSSSVDVQTTPATVLSSIRTAAVAPTFTEGTFTPASLTYAASDAFAKSGVIATVGTGNEDETLIFTAAQTGTASVISDFSGGSKAADTFTAGSAAEFDTASVVGEITSATAAAQTFTGDKISATFSGTQYSTTPTLIKGTKTIYGEGIDFLPAGTVISGESNLPDPTQPEG